MSDLIYNKFLLKLSGESLGDKGLEEQKLQAQAKSLTDIASLGVKLAVVIGGGNWLRGRQSTFLPRTTADQIGMYATAMNGLALASEIQKNGVKTITVSSQAIFGCQTWDQNSVKEQYDSGNIVIFVGGTGNPYFSTDSAAALRAIQMEADILLKGTKYNGIFDKDPEKFKNATAFSEISFNEVISKRLEVMDFTAFDLCSNHKMPIRVFDMNINNAIIKILKGQKIGTLVN